MRWRGVSLSPAENAAGPVWSRPHDLPRTVLTGSHQMPKARCRPLALPVDTPRPLTLTIPQAPVLLTACGKDVASPYRS
jgi:hypothetical protein